MAIISFSYLPVLEEILIDKIQDYFNNIVKWSELYPNFRKIRINNEFPWVPYMNKPNPQTGLPDLGNKPDLFPSITIVNTQDNPSPSKVISITEEVLLKTEFEEFKVLAEKDGYEISKEAILRMEEHFETKDSLVGTTICYSKQDIINIDITVDDHSVVKDRIYDYLRLYLTGHGLLELAKLYSIKIWGESVTGSRSGVYNIEFGRLLRGATIQFKADYNIQQTYYYTDADVIKNVEVEHIVLNEGNVDNVTEGDN